MSSSADTTTTADAEFAAGLRSGVRGLGGIAAIRDNLDDLTEVRRAHRRMMDEMGLAGLLVAEELGGLDTSIRTAAALGRVAGEVPAADLLGPYVEAPVMLGILQAGHPDDAVRELAAGTLTTMADGGDTVTASTDGLIFDAEASELVVVYQDEALHLVPTTALDLTELPAFDPTRTVHRIDPVSVLGAGELLAAGEVASEIAGAALVAGRVYLAAELEGTARALLDETVEFLRSRIAFGRPLGSFQALKHHVAEMWSEVSLIGPLVDQAAHALDEGEDSDEAALYSAAALSFAADTAVAVCERGLQLHGGIGYTWESPVHIWLKRAVANRVRLGTPHTLRTELAVLADI